MARKYTKNRNGYKEKEKKTIKNLNDLTVQEKIEENKIEDIRLDQVFKVTTHNRSFFLNNLLDIQGNLTKEDKTFNVTCIEYVGFFKGKDDVLCVREGENVSYMTHSGVDEILIYDSKLSLLSDRDVWRVIPNNSMLEKYYTIFRENGIILKNDTFDQERRFREALNKKINEILYEKTNS